MYMKLLREAHIYIHVTHTILQCIVQLWAMHRPATNSELVALWSAQCVWTRLMSRCCQPQIQDVHKAKGYVC